MWARIAEVVNPALAALIGYGFGVRARKRGDSPWAAYALALIPGALLAAISHFCFGEDVKTLPDALIWVAWTAFGVWSGWRGERRKQTIQMLNLSGREPRP